MQNSLKISAATVAKAFLCTEFQMDANKDVLRHSWGCCHYGDNCWPPHTSTLRCLTHSWVVSETPGKLQEDAKLSSTLHLIKNKINLSLSLCKMWPSLQNNIHTLHHKQPHHNTQQMRTRHWMWHSPATAVGTLPALQSLRASTKQWFAINPRSELSD